MIKGYIMLGLAILFGLFVWIMVTLIATVIGSNIGKKINQPKMGAWAGFMLTMGGWIVYWVIEYAYVQAKVSYLCHKEAGITVYVTPEQWRKQIGEEEWATLSEFDYIKKQSYPRGDIIYEQKKHVPTSFLNDRLVKYSHHQDISEFIGKTESVIIDIKTQKPILHYTYFSAGAGAWLAGGSPKVWLNNIQSCEDNIYQQFSNRIKFYSNTF